MRNRFCKAPDTSKRYSLTMINKNGWSVHRDASTIDRLKRDAKHFVLSALFAYIYDREKDEMIYQNLYKDRFIKCDNLTFVPYY